MVARRSKEITEEQLARCKRHVSRNGNVFYTVRSESDPTVVHIVCQYRNTNAWFDNCRAGINGMSCNHKRWAIEAERRYREQEGLDRHDGRAIAYNGWGAYQRKPLAWLKIA